jgi:hypothetical protein
VAGGAARLTVLRLSSVINCGFRSPFDHDTQLIKQNRAQPQVELVGDTPSRVPESRASRH